MANHPNAPGPNAPRSDSRAQPTPADQPMSKERAEYLAAQYDFTPAQINVVRNAICVGATDAELEFFLATAKRVGLDPFARQIWFVKRRQKIEDSQGNESWVDVGRPETSIDGFRTVAERTGEYDGQAPIAWCGRDGKWFDVWLKDEPPAAARATVFRKAFREPMVSVALFDEYCPRYKTGGMPAMWKKMPANQLGVRAEAQALRRAFPRDLSGMITDGEAEAMEVASTYVAPAKPEPKQLAPRKPDAAAAIVDATATEKRESAPVAAKKSEPAADAAEIDPATLADAEPDEPDELDREMTRLLNEIKAAKTREDLSPIGRMITEARKRRAVTEDDAHANSVINLLEPALQKRWREVPKK